MSNVRKHLPLLNYMAKGKPSIVKALVKDADAEVIKAICECAHNTIRGNVKLNPAQYKKLKRHSKHLKLLANKRASIKRKKVALQRGGFIGALLGAAVPALASLIGGLVNRR